MKRFMLAFTLLIAAAGFAQTNTKGDSHTPKTPEQRADAYAARMEKSLGLSAEQKTKVHDLALNRAKQMDELRTKYKGQDKSVWKDERKKVRDDFHAGMKSVLSPEQYTKWIEMQKKHQEQKAGGKKGKSKKGNKTQTGGTGTTTGSGTTDQEEESDKDLDGE